MARYMRDSHTDVTEIQPTESSQRTLLTSRQIEMARSQATEVPLEENNFHTKPTSSSLASTTSTLPNQTNSFVKRDAEAYGVQWKPEKMYGFWNPQQVKEKHLMWLKLLGRIGWGAKAVIYATIGGLACDNAVGDKNSSASPQGAFVLIGTANGGRGALVLLAVATATYSAWRFWEGIVGQGYDDNFSKWKNFFKFRLSPFVSGGVYVAYNVLICTTIPKDADAERASLRNSKWPNNWRNSGIGRAFLIIVGIAFVAATIVQLEQFFTPSFHNTIKEKFHWMKEKYNKPFRIFVLVCGHLGVLGRAGIFAFAAVLFFRTVHEDTFQGKSAFGDALAQLQSTKAGCAALFIMGFLVILYGLFAVLNVYARIFPTPPPTGYKKQHRQVQNDLLPQYTGGPTGFNPMGAANSQRAAENGAVPPPPRQSHTYLSPLHNAVNANEHKAGAGQAVDIPASGVPTGYPEGKIQSSGRAGGPAVVSQIP